jgi:hypothetical protein
MRGCGRLGILRRADVARAPALAALAAAEHPQWGDRVRGGRCIPCARRHAAHVQRQQVPAGGWWGRHGEVRLPHVANEKWIYLWQNDYEAPSSSHPTRC